ncbi:MAG TPA: hypothetical protein VHM01_02045 [Alphaproteobacteria bacterium]|nr:hypothetical protein [Alphaproteobacteria bacterium]
MTRIAIRREIADLVLEALDIAVSRRLAEHQTRAFILEVITTERPDITHGDARVLLARVWHRLVGPRLAAAAGAAE